MSGNALPKQLLCSECGHPAIEHDTCAELECNIPECCCRHTALEIVLRAQVSRLKSEGGAESLRAVLGLHRHDRGDGLEARCEECGKPYPCPTRRAIDQLDLTYGTYTINAPKGGG